MGRVGEQVSSQVAIDISTPLPSLCLASGGGRHRDQSSCPSANTNIASAYVNYASIVNNHLKVTPRKKKGCSPPPPPSPGSEWARGVWLDKGVDPAGYNWQH